MDIVQWLNSNNGFMMAVLTAVYVVATLFIVYESRRTNRLQADSITQAEKLELARSRPYVVLSLDFEREASNQYDTAIDLYANVRNFGSTSAHNVLVTTEPILKARLGIDSEHRTPVVIGRTISFMPPGYSIKDLVGYSRFLYEDYEDAKLAFVVTIKYFDVNGVQYEDQYTIDLAAQKERLERSDTEGQARYRVLDMLEKSVRALEEIGRTISAPDRSFFLQGRVEARLGPTQESLLRDLVLTSILTSRVDYFVNPVITGVRIEVIGSEGLSRKVSPMDVEYLCRVGALHGYYRNGALWCQLSPLALELAKRR
ncbi:MAG: hypothetical protein AB7I04_00850 [Pseudomonadales bacterium]